MAPDPKLRINPAVYGAAAQQCYQVASDISTAFNPFYQALYDSSGMAGNYPQVQDWANGYDQHVGDFVTMATTLANATQNMGDLLAYASYNYALTEHLNIDPTTGMTTSSPPDKPAVSSPLFGAENPVLMPGTVFGQPGDGLTTNIPGLLDDIGEPVPNGDTTLLKNAADAWNTFTNAYTITSASDTLKDISTTLTADLKAPDLNHFADHFTTLAKGADDLHSAATALTPLVTAHHDQLNALRTQVGSDTNGLTVTLEHIAEAAAAAVVVTTIFTFGLSLAGGDELEAGAAVAAGAAAITDVAATIVGEISAFTGAVLTGATAAFGGVTALSATGLAAIAVITVLTVSGDSPAESEDDRNPAQDKVLTKGEIGELEDAGYDVHELKGGKNASKYDLYKDRDGNIYVKPKGGRGPGDPTGININDLGD